MEFIFISFIAGILTVLAPCILPLLPVIIGGSLTEKDTKRPVIITISLALSIVLFTLLLKVSTIFIEIPPNFWTWFSAVIVFVFALTLLFPNVFAKISSRFKKDGAGSSQKLLFKFHNKEGFWPAVVLGAALGPVFASCSPTYFLIIGTVLPASFAVGLLNLIVYSAGLALVMFLIAYAGQRSSKLLNLAANPNGWFKKGLGILFLVVALAIATGYDKKFSTYLLDNGLFDITKVEQRILDTKTEPVFEETNEDIFTVNVPAPDIIGLEHWINSDGYSSLEELKGKVVLIDFWTYSCINCIRTLPYLQDWQEKYADEGLVILGIHAPEFAFEKVPENVAKAVKDYGLTYPVAQDNDFRTWRNYNNRYWPAKYLIDQEGNVRYYHFGEGDYDVTEEAITTLLGINMESTVTNKETSRDVRTHETYLGTRRRDNYIGVDAETLGSNQWTLSSGWDADHEKIYSSSFPTSLRMNFYASEANLVMNGNAEVEVIIDGKWYKTITVDGPRLYNIYQEEYSEEHEVQLNFSGEYVEAFAWTFG